MKLNFKAACVILILLLSIFCGTINVYAEDAKPTPAAAVSLISEKEFVKISMQSSKSLAVVNGKNVTLESASTIVNKQLFGPVKFTATTLGAKYDYNIKTKTVTLTKDAAKIVMKVGSRYATVNGKRVTLAAAVTSARSKIAGPIKFIAEALGAKYEWTEKTRTALITASAKFITFPDKNLEASVREALKKATGDLLLSDVGKITFLGSTDKVIGNLDGIQYLTELKYIFFINAQITDISRLSSLKKLESLYLDNNLVYDLNPISKINTLSELGLSNNRIKDIQPLKGLTNLKTLRLDNNLIGDVSVLKSLPKDTQIYLWHANTLERINLIDSKAKEIVSKVIKPEMTDLEKELVLYDYVITHSRYDEENFEAETVPWESHDAYGILTKGIGVCDGYAETMQILLSMAGIESMVVIGDSIGPDSTGHAWNIVKIDGEYFHFDATYDDPVTDDSDTLLYHSYFNVSDRQIAVDHDWDRSKYPECTVDSTLFNVEIADFKHKIITEASSYNVIDTLLYRIEPDGSYKLLCDDHLAQINLAGDWIYYINWDDGEKIYKIKQDGTEKTKVSDSETDELTIIDNWMYYLSDYKIHKVDIETGSNLLLNSDDATAYFAISGEWMFYKAFNLSTSSARLYKVKTDGSSRMMLGDDKQVGFVLTENDTWEYNNSKYELFDGDWIYYINESDSNRLYKIKTDGSGRTKIGDDRLDDYYMEILGGWIYYRNSDDGNRYYRIKADGTEKQLLE